MDGWMYGCIYIYGVKWLQMTQVRQSHPTQTCHSVRKSASDAAEVHAQSMSPSATPATWNEGGCLQVPRLPRQQPRRPRVPLRPKRAAGASPVPYVPRLPRKKWKSMSPSTTPAKWNEDGCLQVPRLPRQQPRRPGATPKTKRATRASPVP